MISRWPCESRNMIRPSRTYAPCFTSFFRLNQKTRARVLAAIPHAGRIIGIQHSEIFRPLVLKDAGLGVHVGGEGAMPVKMVGRDVEHHGNLADERSEWSPAESSKLPAPRWSSVRAARPGKSREYRYCLRPQSESPPAATISPANVVVVVFPFEPVMATIFPGKNSAASSISPMTVSPRARACTSDGASTGTPGLTTISPARETSARHARRFRPQCPGRAARNLTPEFFLRLRVGNSNARSVGLQKKRRSHAGLAQSHHQHAFVVQIHQTHLIREARHRENQSRCFFL